MQGIYTLLRTIIKEKKKIIQEQKKQTKILQAIESGLVVKESCAKMTQIKLAEIIHDPNRGPRI